jgi:hypothetical protein
MKCTVWTKMSVFAIRNAAGRSVRIVMISYSACPGAAVNAKADIAGGPRMGWSGRAPAPSSKQSWQGAPKTKEHAMSEKEVENAVK